MALAGKLAAAFGGVADGLSEAGFGLYSAPRPALTPPEALKQDGRRSMRNPESPDISAQAYLVAARRARHRVRVRQCRHRFRPDHRSARRQRQRRRKFPRVITVPHENVAMAMAHGYYRIARQAGGRDGACHRRHRQHHQRPDERGARQHPDPAGRRPHADHRDRPLRPRATGRSIGARSRSTRAAWSANSPNGTTSCAPASRSAPSSTARSTSP